MSTKTLSKLKERDELTGLDLKEPRQGPGFQNIDSLLYRLEYAGLLLLVLGYLILSSFQPGIDRVVFWLSVLFWAIFPDIASFIPIGLGMSKRTSLAWPAWGSRVYNTFHNLLVWGMVFGLGWLVLRSFYLPLLGWLVHISADRTAGYYLRKSEQSKELSKT